MNNVYELNLTLRELDIFKLIFNSYNTNSKIIDTGIFFDIYNSYNFNSKSDKLRYMFNLANVRGIDKQGLCETLLDKKEILEDKDLYEILTFINSCASYSYSDTTTIDLFKSTGSLNKWIFDPDILNTLKELLYDEENSRLKSFSGSNYTKSLFSILFKIGKNPIPTYYGILDSSSMELLLFTKYLNDLNNDRYYGTILKSYTLLIIRKVQENKLDNYRTLKSKFSRHSDKVIDLFYNILENIIIPLMRDDYIESTMEDTQKIAMEKFIPKFRKFYLDSKL